MKPLAIFPLLLSLACCPVFGKEPSEAKDWEWRGPSETGAWLHTEKSGSTVRFTLELNRGAPSYNSGIASGEFTLNDHLGIYQTNDQPKCVLIFAFIGNTVEIAQVGSDSDCGFGFGVMASHVLTLKK